jgi:prepilin peptidase CpaA
MTWTPSGIQMLASLGQHPHLWLLIALLLLAVCIDWRTLRIPNWLTGGGAALALALSLTGAWPSQPQPWQALAGLGLGLGLMLPLYLLGVMGAGDVKLMAMAGAYLGPQPTWQAVLWVWFTGGLIALAVVAGRHAWRALAINLRELLVLRNLTLCWCRSNIDHLCRLNIDQGT